MTRNAHPGNLAIASDKLFAVKDKLAQFRELERNLADGLVLKIR
jgi:hypothetical protein